MQWRDAIINLPRKPTSFDNDYSQKIWLNTCCLACCCSFLFQQNLKIHAIGLKEFFGYWVFTKLHVKWINLEHATNVHDCFLTAIGKNTIRFFSSDIILPLRKFSRFVSFRFCSSSNVGFEALEMRMEYSGSDQRSVI